MPRRGEFCDKGKYWRNNRCVAVNAVVNKNIPTIAGD
jgi:hypothetical protein